MKKIIVLSALSAVVSANAAVTLSNPALAPTNNVAVSQLDSTGDYNVQARNLTSDMSQWRVITETFDWTVGEDFDGIGLYMGVGLVRPWHLPLPVRRPVPLSLPGNMPSGQGRRGFRSRSRSCIFNEPFLSPCMRTDIKQP